MGRRAVEIQTRGNGLGVSSLVMKGRGIWHWVKGVGELVSGVGGKNRSLTCKTFPLSYAFLAEATKALGKSTVDEAKIQSKTRLEKDPVNSLGLERSSAGV